MPVTDAFAPAINQCLGFIVDEPLRFTGKIADTSECEAADGKFLKQAFGLDGPRLSVQRRRLERRHSAWACRSLPAADAILPRQMRLDATRAGLGRLRVDDLTNWTHRSSIRRSFVAGILAVLKGDQKCPR